jgi:thymidylate synthase
MRSQDAIFGMGNDAPTFSFIHEMIYNALLEKYPNLDLGEYCHIADSFHVYERHFDMLSKIVAGDEYVHIECPRISGPDEVRFLRACDFSTVPEGYLFTKWLLSKEEVSGK